MRNCTCKIEPRLLIRLLEKVEHHSLLIINSSLLISLYHLLTFVLLPPTSICSSLPLFFLAPKFSLMKRNLFFFFCVVKYCIALSQPSSHDEEIMQIKGKWAKHETVNQRADPALFSSQFAVLLKKTDTIATLLQKTYPDPTGLEAAYYSSIDHSPMFEGGPASYELNSFFESYYFNTHLNKILKETETETWVNFSVNRVRVE